MKDIQNLLPRLLEPSLTEALRTFPVVVVTGPRQAGKSTLVRNIHGARSRSYVTLDDLDVLERAQQEPAALLEGRGDLTLDEVQHAPDLLRAIKRSVDDDRRPGRFLLTGSANLLLMRHVSETMAGRAIYFTLWPLTRREQQGRASSSWEPLLEETDESRWPDIVRSMDAPEERWQDLALRGGFPTPAHELSVAEDRARWFTGYAQTYLERDVRDHVALSSPIDLRRLMRLACLRIGNVLNQADLARDAGVSHATAHRYLDVLEASYQLVRLPAYSVNRSKRLIKSPKVFWTDTGLAMHLAGEHTPRGAHLENLVLSDLLAWSSTAPDAPQVLYWRTASGHEVDFVIEWRGSVVPIEVKASARPRIGDARSLQLFRAEYPDHSRTALLLHTGSEIMWLAEGVLAVPWWRLV